MALPLIITSGRYKQSDGDIEIPGTIVTIDSDNAGAGANVDIVANQGSDNNGTIRYNATTNQWEISNDGGTFQSIAGGSNTDTYDRSAVFSVPEGNATLTEANVGIAISAGSVIGLGIICDDAVTAGTITVTVKVGGVSGLVAVLNTTDTTKQSATASSGTYTVASQDQITIEVVTAGGYTNAATAATNLDVRLTVINDASSSSSTASGTLDTAYNGGRTVTVDAGAVILDADIADTSEALTITRQPGSSAAAVGMSITMGSNATGDGLVVTHSGSGDGLQVTMGASATGAAIRCIGQAGSAKNTLTDAATIATNCALGNVHEVTLGGNRTLGAPTNPVPGFTYLWIIKQDGIGSRTLAYNAVFDFPGGTAPTLSTGVSAVDLLSAVYTGTSFLCTFEANFS